MDVLGIADSSHRARPESPRHGQKHDKRVVFVEEQKLLRGRSRSNKFKILLYEAKRNMIHEETLSWRLLILEPTRSNEWPLKPR